MVVAVAVAPQAHPAGCAGGTVTMGDQAGIVRAEPQEPETTAAGRVGNVRAPCRTHSPGPLTRPVGGTERKDGPAGAGALLPKACGGAALPSGPRHHAIGETHGFACALHKCEDCRAQHHRNGRTTYDHTAIFCHGVGPAPRVFWSHEPVNARACLQLLAINRVRMLYQGRLRAFGRGSRDQPVRVQLRRGLARVGVGAAGPVASVDDGRPGLDLRWAVSSPRPLASAEWGRGSRGRRW